MYIDKAEARGSSTFVDGPLSTFGLLKVVISIVSIVSLPSAKTDKGSFVDHFWFIRQTGSVFPGKPLLLRSGWEWLGSRSNGPDEGRIRQIGPARDFQAQPNQNDTSMERLDHGDRKTSCMSIFCASASHHTQPTEGSSIVDWVFVPPFCTILHLTSHHPNNKLVLFVMGRSPECKVTLLEKALLHPK